MSEVNGKTLSISFRIDEGVIEHNNRIFIAQNGYWMTLQSIASY